MDYGGLARGSFSTPASPCFARNRRASPASVGNSPSGSPTSPRRAAAAPAYLFDDDVLKTRSHSPRRTSPLRTRRAESSSDDDQSSSGRSGISKDQLKYSRDIEDDWDEFFWPPAGKKQKKKKNKVLSVIRPGDLTTRRTTLAVFIVFLTNMLDWCLISALNPTAPGYLDLDKADQGAVSRLGVVISANAGVQLITSMFSGRLVDKFGSAVPFTAGLVIMLASTLVLAFAGDITWDNRYMVVLGCRLVQGASSGLASTAGMAWLLSLFSDEKKRARAIGLAVTGVGLGIIVGMPLGSVFTSFGVVAGWRATFLLLDALLLLNICLLFYALGGNMPQFKKVDDGLGWQVVVRLAFDPCIFHIFMLSFLLNLGMSSIEATLPSWVTLVLDAPSWSLGVMFLSCHIPYTVVAAVCAQAFLSVGRHYALMLGNICLGFGMYSVPTVMYFLYEYDLSSGFVCVPLFLIGVGLGLVDSVSLPFAADVVQKRHANLMGSSCAVITASWSLGFFLGPLLINFLVDLFGYQWVYVGAGQTIFLSGFTALALKHLTEKQEQRV